MASRRKTPKKHRDIVNAARPYYDAMFEAQDGKCAICERGPYEDRRFDIDHNHQEMYIRGLLCIRCNQWLWGFVTIDILKATIKYLLRGPKWFQQIKENVDNGR